MTEREISRSIALSMLQYGADKAKFNAQLAGWRRHLRSILPIADRPQSQERRAFVVRSFRHLSDSTALMSSFVVVGGPTSEHQKLYDLAKSVHMKAVEYMRPGLTGSDVLLLSCAKPM